MMYTMPLKRPHIESALDDVLCLECCEHSVIGPGVESLHQSPHNTPSLLFSSLPPVLCSSARQVSDVFLPHLSHCFPLFPRPVH